MSLPTDGTSMRIDVTRQMEELRRMEAEARARQQPPAASSSGNQDTSHTRHHHRHHHSHGRRRMDHRVAFTGGEQEVIRAVHADATVHNQDAPDYTPYQVIRDLQARGVDTGRFGTHTVTDSGSTQRPPRITTFKPT